VFVVVRTERSDQRQSATKSSTCTTRNLDQQANVWTAGVPSPWQTAPQSSSRQTQTPGSGGSGERLNNYAKLDYCNSQQTAGGGGGGALSRSWFDIDRPHTSSPASPMSSSALALAPCLRQSSSTDPVVDKAAGTITETNTNVCSICSSEAFITEDSSPAKSDVGRSDEQRVYRVGGSLPRCLPYRCSVGPTTYIYYKLPSAFYFYLNIRA